MRTRIVLQAMAAGAAATALLALAGCHVQVDKSSNGDSKNVRIETPLGGLHVRSDQTTAANLGLPVYPGAQVAPDNSGDKSADVDMGFGKWQLRVKVVTYTTADPRDKVLAFYRSAMGPAGDVIECDGHRAVGTPTVTSEGLTCEEDGKTHVQVNGVQDESGLSLRSGSRHHQRLVVFKDADSGTKFSLVELQLPEGLTDGKHQTSD